MLDKRKIEILEAIIDSYISSAEPIGSRTLSKNYDLGVSSATIRNEMADLEELGYLNKPHSSAGRVPSDKAYRLYVDHLLECGIELDEEGEDELYEMLMPLRFTMDDMILGAAGIISAFTNYTAVSITKKLKPMQIVDLSLVFLDLRRCMAILVCEDGTVRTTVVSSPKNIERNLLDEMSKVLKSALISLGPVDAERELGILNFRDDNLWPRLKSALMSTLRELSLESSDLRANVGGISKVLYYPEYSDVQKARDFMDFLEDTDTFLNALSKHREASGIMLTIGGENEHENLKESSIITASYKVGDDLVGKIGIIGPTRMDYLKLMKTLKLFTEDIEEIIDKFYF